MKRQLSFELTNGVQSSAFGSCSGVAASSMASLASVCASSSNSSSPSLPSLATTMAMTAAAMTGTGKLNGTNGTHPNANHWNTRRDESMMAPVPAAAPAPAPSSAPLDNDRQASSYNEDGEKIFQELGAALELAFQRNQYPKPLDEVAIGPISAICDKLLPKHLKLPVPEVSQSFKHDPEELIKYVHIWTDDDCNVCVFVLPPGAKIPMHNHPNMSVVSRLLYGNLHIKSYDLVTMEGDNIVVNNSADPPRPSQSQSQAVSSNGSNNRQPRRHLARVLTDTWVRAPCTTHLLPDRGNIHEFVSGDDIGCAIFDILTPPYDASQGRECTYYRLADRLEMHKNGQVLVELEECDAGDYYVDPQDYSGPALFSDQTLSEDESMDEKDNDDDEEEEQEGEEEQVEPRAATTTTGIMYPPKHSGKCQRSS